MSRLNPYLRKHRLLLALLAGNLAYFVSIFIHDSFDFVQQNYHIPDHLYALLMMGIFVETIWAVAVWLDQWLLIEHKFKQRAIVQGLFSLGAMIGLITLADATLPGFTLNTLRHFQEFEDVAHSVVIKKVRVYSTFGFTAVLLNIVYFGWRFFRDFHVAQLKAEQLHKETVANQLQTLKNQIHPRFWFASLEALIQLVHQDPDLSEKFIKKLSLFYRYNITNSEKELITLAEELEFVNIYIDLINIKNPAMLKWHHQLAPAMLQYLLPSKALQKVFEQVLETHLYDATRPLTLKLSTNPEANLIVTYSGLKKLHTPEYITQDWLVELNQIYQFYTPQKVQEHTQKKQSQVVLPLLQVDG
ncbi:histidine kinase [Microscilla marina]|uniref:Putative two-component system sensor protein histidine kinase n=1 Tax=Microscilla marina ATCC 23134 TaxID=313606 RepID=A1ZUH5_MICM2|nr:histidine kinase [Microscilla marina]EAY25994.1 putative two-component system sensor protein histidine kinase [Microscilla marina ATCC 23134]